MRTGPAAGQPPAGRPPAPAGFEPGRDENLPRRQREFRYTPTVSAGGAGFADDTERIGWLDDGRARPRNGFSGGPRESAPPLAGDPFGMSAGGLGTEQYLRPEDELQGSPGYEFGPGTGPLRALTPAIERQRATRPPQPPARAALAAASTDTDDTDETAEPDNLTVVERLIREIREALRIRSWVVKVGVPILAMIPVGIAVVIIAGANNSNGTTSPTPDTTSLGFPPANFATADFTTTAGQAGRGIDQKLGAVAASGDEIVAIGSETGSQTAHTEFFVSQNAGKTWRLATEQGAGGANPAPGHTPTHIAVGPDGWVAVGPDSIWTSQNGTTWTLDSATGLPTQAGDQINVLTRTANGFLAAGQNGTTPVVWLSANGTTWQRTQPALAGARDIRFAVGTANAIVVAGDRTVGGSGVWRSTDGTTWTEVTVPSIGTKDTIAGLAQLANGFVAVRPGTRASRAVVYTSATGQDWTQSALLKTTDGAPLTLSLIRGGTSGVAVTGHADGFLIAFISSNGTTWAGTDPFGTTAGETEAGVALTSGNVVVATGDGRVTNGRRGSSLALVGTMGAARHVTVTGPVQHQLAVTSAAASGATQVAVGGADGFPAIWVSGDGGTTWTRAASAALTRAGDQQLTGVAHGDAGWVAVGGVLADATAHPVVVTSADGTTWTTADSEEAFAGAGVSATAVAAGQQGYVIVGQRGRTPVAWFSTGLTGWQRVTLPAPAGSDITAVAASGRGFVAVGTSGTHPITLISQNGTSWALGSIPLPQGATSAALHYVAAVGDRVAAAGEEVTASGQSRPFAAESTNGGDSWVDSELAVTSGNAMVTALTAAGSGFTATGVFGSTPGNLNVVIWTLHSGTAWSEAAPSGRGLQGTGIQEITALTAAGNELTGIGFVATATSEEPTIWQSPVRG